MAGWTLSEERSVTSETDQNPLALWLTRHNHSQSWLARILGISRQSVSRWVNGQARPRYDYALAIEELSGGELQLKDLADPRNVGKARPALLTILPAR